MTTGPKRPNGRAARASRGPTRIEDWVLHADIGVLRGDQGEVRLNPKTLHVLLVLLDAGDQGVAREALLDQVWGENYPSDGVVSRAMADLRAAFGEKAGEQKYIRTLPKFGYQFVASHSPVDATAASKVEPKHRQQISPLWYLFFATALLAIVWFVNPVRQTETFNGNAKPILSGQRPLTSAPGLEHQPRFIPGGEWIAYAVMRTDRNDWDLFRVSATDGVSQPIAVSPDVHEHGPAIAPSGEELAYVRLWDDQCNVVVQSVTLGVPEPLAVCTTKFATVVDWSPNDNWLAYTTAQTTEKDSLRRIYAVNRFSRETRQVTDAVSATGTDYYPRYSPSGKKLAFLRGEPQPDHRSTIWIVDVESGEEKRLTQLPTQIGGMTWLDENRLLYSKLDGGRMRGRLIDSRHGEYLAIEANEFMHPEIDRIAGRLVVAEPRSDSDLAILGPGGEIRTIARSTGDDHHGSLSPDEDWIAFISRRSGFDELWIAQTRGDLSRRLTRFDGATVRYPDWHPDGEQILFTVQTKAGERLYMVDIVSGTPQAIQTGFADVTMPRWLPDGREWVAGCRDSDGWGICVGDDQATRKVIADYYRPRPASDGTIYVVDDPGMLFTLSIDNASVASIWNGLPGNGRYAWVTEDGMLYFVAGDEAGNASQLWQRDIESGATELIHEGLLPMADMTLSIGRKTGSILFTQMQISSDDLVLYPVINFD